MTHAITFKSTEDFFCALLGPPQHDWHVGAYRKELLRRELEASAARAAAFDAKAFLRELCFGRA